MSGATDRSHAKRRKNADPKSNLSAKKPKLSTNPTAEAATPSALAVEQASAAVAKVGDATGEGAKAPEPAEAPPTGEQPPLPTLQVDLTKPPPNLGGGQQLGTNPSFAPRGNRRGFGGRVARQHGTRDGRGQSRPGRGSNKGGANAQPGTQAGPGAQSFGKAPGPVVSGGVQYQSKAMQCKICN